MKAKEILKQEFGDEADDIFNEIKEEINEIISSGGDYDDVEEVLMNYGLEMDYIFDFV
jgi:phage/plasmid-associated DNA primase